MRVGFRVLSPCSHRPPGRRGNKGATSHNAGQRASEQRDRGVGNRDVLWIEGHVSLTVNASWGVPTGAQRNGAEGVGPGLMPISRRTLLSYLVLVLWKRESWDLKKKVNKIKNHCWKGTTQGDMC